MHKSTCADKVGKDRWPHLTDNTHPLAALPHHARNSAERGRDSYSPPYRVTIVRTGGSRADGDRAGQVASIRMGGAAPWPVSTACHW